MSNNYTQYTPRVCLKYIFCIFFLFCIFGKIERTDKCFFCLFSIVLSNFTKYTPCVFLKGIFCLFGILRKIEITEQCLFCIFCPIIHNRHRVRNGRGFFLERKVFAFILTIEIAHSNRRNKHICKLFYKTQSVNKLVLKWTV